MLPAGNGAVPSTSHHRNGSRRLDHSAPQQPTDRVETTNAKICSPNRVNLDDHTTDALSASAILATVSSPERTIHGKPESQYGDLTVGEAQGARR